MESDIERQILEEMRKQRKIIQESHLACAIIMIVVLIWAYFMMTPLVRTKNADSWSGVSKAISSGHPEKALKIAKRLEARHPQDEYAHYGLGKIYLALGDVVKAEKEFSRAYELLPTKDNEELLTAVRKRLKSKH